MNRMQTGYVPKCKSLDEVEAITKSFEAFKNSPLYGYLVREIQDTIKMIWDIDDSDEVSRELRARKIGAVKKMQWLTEGSAYGIQQELDLEAKALAIAKEEKE